MTKIRAIKLSSWILRLKRKQMRMSLKSNKFRRPLQFRDLAGFKQQLVVLVLGIIVIK